MKLIEAKVAGKPRIVSTKHGERSVMDCRTSNGETIPIWRPAGDAEVMHRANGERVMLAIDAKGKASLVETAKTRAEDAAARPMGFTIETTTPPAEVSRSIEIADYIERLGKLYGHCYKTAAQQLESTALETLEVKDVATTLFIQTVKHFSL